MGLIPVRFSWTNAIISHKFTCPTLSKQLSQMFVCEIKRSFLECLMCEQACMVSQKKDITCFSPLYDIQICVSIKLHISTCSLFISMSWFHTLVLLQEVFCRIFFPFLEKLLQNYGKCISIQAVLQILNANRKI